MIDAAVKQARPRQRKQNFSAVGKFAARAEANFDASRSAAEARQINVVEKLASLFEPDTLAPAQYFGERRRKSLIEPEKKLMVAILEDAINCFQDNVLVESGKRKKLFEDAQEWFMAEDSDWIFSCQNVCELLGLSPEYLREGLMRWKEQELARHYDSDVCDGTKMAV